MPPRALPLLLCSSLLLGNALAADGGAGAHARGPFDATSGVYTVVRGDALESIATRFGTSIAQLEQQNRLASRQIRVGQTLVVTDPAPTAPSLAPAEPVTSLITAPMADAAPVHVAVPPIATVPVESTIVGTPSETVPLPQIAATPNPAPVPPPLPADPWPRQVQVDDRTLLIYQPQVVSWTGNQLALRAAVAVQPQGQGQQSFGVIEAQAQTQVDRVRRMAVLQNLKVTQADFPTVPALTGSLAPAVARQFGANVRIVPLDRLEAALGATQAQPAVGVTVENPLPRVIVNFEPAILVPIQGNPVLKPVPDTRLQRVINTRAVILTESADGPYYLHLLDGWVAAQTLAGPWEHAAITPDGMDEVASRLATAGHADLLNGNPSTPTLQLLAAGIPDVFVTEGPTELIVFKGQPNLVPIPGTRLLWAANTSANVIVDTEDNIYYALMAGRWYNAADLRGPWAYVASTALPADFKQIPVNSHAGVVLSAVAGTTQAREALIANSIPQTAAVRRQGGPSFTPVFDGPATVSLLKGTDLEYVVNSETPIVRVDGDTYYALQAGVWFQSAAPEGPWTVTDSVPQAIYGIPPSSPLHYVTYARVYGSTSEAVYVGYTPGYLGTIADTDGVVVYGTGYDYQPWIGDTWYAAPETFGLAAQPLYHATLGYGYGFGLGPATAAVADSYWGGVNYRLDAAGIGCCIGTGANVYTHWGDTVAAGTRTWFDSAEGALGTTTRGDDASLPTGEDRTVSTARIGDSLYAGADGNVYRHTDAGWQQHNDGGWQDAGTDTAWADRDRQARAQGDDRMSGFQGGGLVDRGGDDADVGGDRSGGTPFSGGFGGRFGGGDFGGRGGGRR